MFILAGCDAEWGFFGELIFDFAAGCDTLERRLIGPGTGILATHEPRSRLIDQVPVAQVLLVTFWVYQC